jgi:hypothetical protein
MPCLRSRSSGHLAPNDTWGTGKGGSMLYGIGGIILLIIVVILLLRVV